LPIAIHAQATVSPPLPSPPRSGRDYPASNTFVISEERGCYSPGGAQPLYPEFKLGAPRNRIDSDGDKEPTESSNSEQGASPAQLDTHPTRPSIAAPFSFLQDTSFDSDLEVITTNGKYFTNNILQERQKTCSGRDELCNSVLNDEWASHPTWASEDSGFIAHKKNVHEEGLHRIEEERHDYDFNIESCSRTIQLLEPLAQSLRRLTESEQLAFKLPPGLGGQSETIYRRVIMKLYGREKGQEVISQLHLRPYQVIPVLLNRLKERLETWKLAQREWEKVWREQTQRMFWKSLDHQHANTRASDKRAIQLKVLQTEIQMKHEEMKREDKQVPGVMHKPQLEYLLEDTDVILDLSHLLLVQIDQTMSTDTPRLLPFVKEFIPVFFGLDSEWFNSQINARLSATPVNEAADDYPSGAEEALTPRGRKAKSNNLLRSALDRGRGRAGRKDRDDSNASASRASTPDVASVADDEMAIDTAEEGEQKPETSTSRWLDHPAVGNVLGDKSVDPGEAYQRQTFRMWSNTPMYGFVRMFIMLYERLLKLKQGENECRETVRKAKTNKPAVELGIIDKQPQDFFDDISPNADYYRQMLDKFVRCLVGDLDFAEIEETLRRFYLQSGYPLYSLDKIVNQLARFAGTVLSSESKERSYEIYSAFKRDRLKETTTAQQQTDYRKSVEKMLKDGELYRIDFVRTHDTSEEGERQLTHMQDQDSRHVRFYLTKKDDPTFDDSLSAADKEHLWRYYLASYTSMAPTEGVDFLQLSRPILSRNIRASGVDPQSTTYPPSPADGDEASNQRLQRRFDNNRGKENLTMRIAVNNYVRIFQPHTEESYYEDLVEREGSGEDDFTAIADTHDRREEMAKGTYARSHLHMKDFAQQDVEKLNVDFGRMIEEGEQGEGEPESMDVE
jgi:paired amphipathic helix protein Sin3a